MFRPIISISEKFKTNYPNKAKKYDLWLTSNIREDFIKIESIIDFLRK